MISAVGTDVGRTIIEKSCIDSGVNVAHLLEYPEASTGSYLAVNNQLGALLAAVADMSIIDNLTRETLATKSHLFTSHQQLVAEANLKQDALLFIAENKQQLPLFIDAVSATKAPKLRPILEHIDLLKVNREEATAILNIQADDATLAEALYDRGVASVLLSQGPHGAIIYNHHGLIRKAAIKGVNASDTGAGDALFAGYIAARDLLNAPTDQLEFAIACATFTLNSHGSVNPDLSVNAIHTQYLSHLRKEAWRH